MSRFAGVKCGIDGCERQAKYKALCLCQTHYHRLYRTGTTDKRVTTANPRFTMPGRGYQFVHCPDHPLAAKNGYVSEHRKVVFDDIGWNLSQCELCGKPESWATVHIDHIDDNPKNNERSNLRPLCRSCNVYRNYPDRHTFKGNHSITLGDVSLTAREWARVLNFSITGATISRRIKSGMTPEEALLSPKVTHTSKKPMQKYTREGLIEIARHYRESARKLKK